MTEEQWLTPGDLKQHLDWSWARNTPRKLRLFGVACCRQLEAWIDEPVLHDAIQRAERLADGMLSESTIEKWRQKVSRLEYERRTREGRAWTPQTAVFKDVRFVCHESRYRGFADTWRTLVYHGSVFGEEFMSKGPSLAHCLLLDVFGNPFRPVTFNPAWRTSSAIGLAQTMYEARDFHAMPVLADALEETGCDHPDVLAHCRNPEPVHVRGCWVVDLVLGKS